jgi:hypothetical protein
MIEAKCPLCEWNVKQSLGKQDEDLIRSYIAKALMGHLRLKHARHDELRSDNIAFSTIISGRTKRGMIEFSLNSEMSQWDLDKAREIHQMLGQAIEAAVSDTIVYRFLTEKLGLTDDQASHGLLEFRELRQGSKEFVRPN